jgi:hypothetical protein
MPPNENREKHEWCEAGKIELLLGSQLIRWSEQFTINFVGSHIWHSKLTDDLSSLVRLGRNC